MFELGKMSTFVSPPKKPPHHSVKNSCNGTCITSVTQPMNTGLSENVMDCSLGRSASVTEDRRTQKQWASRSIQWYSVWSTAQSPPYHHHHYSTRGRYAGLQRFGRRASTRSTISPAWPR